MNERIAALEKEILERRNAEAEKEERIAELLSSKSVLEKQGREIVRLAEDLAVARDQGGPGLRGGVYRFGLRRGLRRSDPGRLSTTDPAHHSRL